MTAIAPKLTDNEQKWQALFVALSEIGKDSTEDSQSRSYIDNIPVKTSESGIIIAHLARFLKKTSNERLKVAAAFKLKDFVRAGDDSNQTALNALIACKDDIGTPITWALLICYPQIILANKDSGNKAMQALGALANSPHTTPILVFKNCMEIYCDGTESQSQAAGKIMLDIAKTATSDFKDIEDECWNAIQIKDKDRLHVAIKILAGLPSADPERKLSLIGTFRVIVKQGNDHENIILKCLAALSRDSDRKIRASAAEECLEIVFLNKDPDGIALEAFIQGLGDKKISTPLAEKAVKLLGKKPADADAVKNLTTAFSQAGTSPSCPKRTRAIINAYLIMRPKDTGVHDLATALGLEKR